MLRIVASTALLALLAACGGRSPLLLEVHPARPLAPYAERLASCTRASGLQRSCTLVELPLLGMELATPGSEDLMQRVATTHPWMAQRFEELLAYLPASLLELSRSVSALVIAADVRPAFYWRRTAAIYLDPAELWLSVEEKRTIDPSPDFRRDFGSRLNFRIISRYVLNNQYAWYSYSLEDDSERSLEDIIAPLSRLLFHELAHAGDFFPRSSLAQLDRRLTTEAAAEQIAQRGAQLSQRLHEQFPLRSELMTGLAQVNFAGEEADARQLRLQPQDVVAEFQPDDANDDYSYFSRHEDVAMLFEELMMDYSFKIRRDVAVTEPPDAARNYQVEWGERGRIAAEHIAPRAEFIVSRLLPETDFSAYFATQAEAQELRSGAGWNDNLNPQASGKLGRDGAVQWLERDLVIQ